MPAADVTTNPSGPTVLVVEDHPLHARVLRRALAARLPGGRIELFADGTDACRRLMDGAVPDLLVLDLDLPGRSGHDVLALCVSEGRLRAMQTVVVTSSTAVADRERSLELGAALHLPKPVDAAGFMQLADGLAALIGPSRPG
jgi:two-component system, chemotaxis family, response regulator Rcp1